MKYFVHKVEQPHFLPSTVEALTGWWAVTVGKIPTRMTSIVGVFPSEDLAKSAQSLFTASAEGPQAPEEKAADLHDRVEVLEFAGALIDEQDLDRRVRLLEHSVQIIEERQGDSLCDIGKTDTKLTALRRELENLIKTVNETAQIQNDLNVELHTRVDDISRDVGTIQRQLEDVDVARLRGDLDRAGIAINELSSMSHGLRSRVHALEQVALQQGNKVVIDNTRSYTGAITGDVAAQVMALFVGGDDPNEDNLSSLTADQVRDAAHFKDRPAAQQCLRQLYARGLLTDPDGKGAGYAVSPAGLTLLQAGSAVLEAAWDGGYCA